MAKYTVNQLPVSTLLAQVQSDQIAIPELQRPFVWDSVKVRDLMDSLYRGFPVGYLITWQSQGAHLKGGQTAAHQQILIDGQQRVTALRAAVAGLPVVIKNYTQRRIVIAFNPLTEEFATVTPVIRRNSEWISDISEIFQSSASCKLVNSYLQANPDVEQDLAADRIQKLSEVKNAQIGVIALSDDLDVETVSEIFIRINSKGVPLSSADFAVSKIATYGDRGRNLRKLIDYFCHLAVAPHAYSDIANNDVEFAQTPHLQKIARLKDVAEDLYDPTYSDIVRVAGLVGFTRGKASSIVSELSGRDPDIRKVDVDRIPLAYDKLESALDSITSKYHFENFLMTIKSSGFIASKLINSQNALNFAYALYLRMRLDTSLTEGDRKRITRRWFVMSMLTGRHSGSFESTWEQDMKRIAQYGAGEYLKQLEESNLGEDFWNVSLPRGLETSRTNSPFFQTFVAAQISQGSRGFLSKHILVATMHEHSGDIHHVVPKNYLVKAGYADRNEYNQVANFAITETAINIAIKDQAPEVYLARVRGQIQDGQLSLGELIDQDDYEKNLAENALPTMLESVTAESYPEYLDERRRLMAKFIRNFYEKL
ncbi:GmrSD restriction endonuclease domain-containing protein [Neomicrococcus lactis]